MQPPTLLLAWPGHPALLPRMKHPHARVAPSRLDQGCICPSAGEGNRFLNQAPVYGHSGLFPCPGLQLSPRSLGEGNPPDPCCT